MKNLITIILVFGTMNFVVSQSFSAFIDYVNILPENERTEAVDSFMTIITPLGIPYMNDDTANFIYQGVESTVQIAGDFNGWNPQFFHLANVSGTDFWYRPQIFELNARLDYKFVLSGGSWILDPLNPNQIWGGYGPNSELAMPEYVQPWEIEFNPGIEHGIIETDEIYSSITDYTYDLQIYLPINYNPERSDPYPVAYFQDGHEYVSLGSADNVLDNLVHENLIDSIIAVFVKPNNRNEEYAGNLRVSYRLFFVQELVPYIDENYNTIKNPWGRAVIGDSFGGNISALISYNNPDVFGLCGLHSGAFWPNDYEAYDLIVNGTVHNIKWVSIWGTYEGLYENMRDLRDFLTDNGYELKWSELPEGHSWGLWRATIDEILTYFFPPGYSSVASSDGNTEMDITVYPNPVKNSTTLSFELIEKSSVIINVLNISGQLQSTQDFGEKEKGLVELRINTEELSKGIYLLEVSTSIGTVSCRFIKE